MSEPLPELSEALLDRETLERLFVDLDACTRVLDVLLKRGPTRRTDGRPVGLGEARDLLLTGEVRGLQIRYLYQGVEWRDTLLRTPEGVRLVRMQMEHG